MRTVGEVIKEYPRLTLITAVIGLAVVIGLGANAYDWLKTPEPATIVATTPTVDPVKQMDELLAALLRSYAIVEACYDSKNNGYLIKVGPHTHSDDVYDQGWYFVEEYNFLPLENGTYFVKMTGNWIAVSPDVTGLKCKQQAPDPSWFR